MNDIKEKIYSLRESLSDHNYRYYVLSSPIISDQEFDLMMKELERLEQEHPEFYDPNSPTQRVGSDLSGKGEKVKHDRPMLSLTNTYSHDEVVSFYQKVASTLNKSPLFEVELKLDGVSISLHYKDGAFEKALTRGDGEYGEDVTQAIKAIPSIPLRLRGEKYPSELEVRGEIVLPWDRFEAINREREMSGDPLFANPRNAVSGTIKQYSPALVAERRPDAYFYYLLSDENLPDSQIERIRLLQQLGFKTESHSKTYNTPFDIIAYIEEWQDKLNDLPFATDGVVIKVDSNNDQKKLGITAKSPKWAIAYKYPAQQKETILRGVEYQVGRTGVVTPVALLKPTLLSGSTVSKATLHNADFIKNLDLRIGDHVIIEKGGEIIPKIIDVNKKKRSSEIDSPKVEYPIYCPVCQTKLIKSPEMAATICPNEIGCPAQIMGSIEHFCSRKAMNINIGPETIKDLYSQKLVNNFADLYNLTTLDLALILSLREKSRNNLYKSIQDSKNATYDKVLYALGIPLVGEVTARLLSQKYDSIDKLSSADSSELQQIDGIGEIMAETIFHYFKEKYHIKLINQLKSAGLKLSQDQLEEGETSDALINETIVVSGTFEKLSRSELKNILIRHGAKVTSSVSGNTTLVIAGEKMGPKKRQEAEKLGVKIISEDDFLEMMEKLR